MTPGQRQAAVVLAAMILLAAACRDDDGAVGSSEPATATSPATVAPATTTTTPPATSTGSSTTASTLPAAPPVGDLAILDAALDDDGTMALEPAMRLFAAGYAPMPGVDPAPTALVDGSPVLRTLLANLDRLSAAQQAAVTAVTDAPGVFFSDAPDDPRIQKAIGTISFAQQLFGEFLSRRLSDDVAVTIAPLPYANPDGSHNFSGASSFAAALPFAADGVTYDECRIRVNTDAPVDATLGYDDLAFVSALAEETFHCLQFALVGTSDDVPLWVMEGAAAFAGEDFAGGTHRSAQWWSRWIAEPHRPLQLRTRDAAGFFFLLKASDVDTYKFADVFLSDSSPASIRRRLDATVAFDRWGTQYATTPAWGDAYTIAGSGAPADLAAPAMDLVLTEDGPPVVADGATAASELSGGAYRFTAPGDVLVVTTDPGDRGGIRFGDGTESRLPEASQAYCLLADGCVCPGTSPEQTTASDVASVEVFLGVGPSSGGGPQFAARSLGQWCNEVLVPPPPVNAVDPCLARRWISSGYEPPAQPGVRQEATGGDGAVLDLRPDRSVTVDMTNTTPVVVTSQRADDVLTTSTLEFAGSGSGTWSAEAGVVAVAGVDTTPFTVRLRVESSTGGQMTDLELEATDSRLSSVGGLLGTSRYECSAVSMTLAHVAPVAGGEAAFTFTPG